MSGNLYLVATPIGNLEDITLRAINTLKSVDLIAAEDTRHTLKLLNHLEISKPLISYYRHNEKIKTDSIIEKIKEGKNIALVSDAGTPAISDPGEEIVKKAIEEDIRVIPIPGACALITGLIASGISTEKFSFLGFLSLNKKLRKEQLEKIKAKTETVILYEAPHKIQNTIEDLYKILGNREVVLCRELTKIHEEYARGDLSNVLDKIGNIKGEFVIIIKGNKELKAEENFFDNMSLEEHFDFYKNQGIEKKEIIKLIAKDKNVAKNEIYQKFV